MQSIEEILVQRDGISKSEAKSIIDDAVEELNGDLENLDYFDEVDFCAEHFGLEPDYFYQVLELMN